MSWGCEFTGTKDAVVSALSTYLDKTAKGDAGKEEANDILACKDRAIALINALDLTADSYVNWNGATVKASGSHSATRDGSVITSANFQLSVVRVALTL